MSEKASIFSTKEGEGTQFTITPAQAQDLTEVSDFLPHFFFGPALLSLFSFSLPVPSCCRICHSPSFLVFFLGSGTSTTWRFDFGSNWESNFGRFMGRKNYATSCSRTQRLVRWLMNHLLSLLIFCLLVLFSSCVLQRIFSWDWRPPQLLSDSQKMVQTLWREVRPFHFGCCSWASSWMLYVLTLLLELSWWSLFCETSLFCFPFRWFSYWLQRALQRLLLANMLTVLPSMSLSFSTPSLLPTQSGEWCESTELNFIIFWATSIRSKIIFDSTHFPLAVLSLRDSQKRTEFAPSSGETISAELYSYSRWQRASHPLSRFSCGRCCCSCDRWCRPCWLSSPLNCWVQSEWNVVERRARWCAKGCYVHRKTERFWWWAEGSPHSTKSGFFFDYRDGWESERFVICVSPSCFFPFQVFLVARCGCRNGNGNSCRWNREASWSFLGTFCSFQSQVVR